MIAVGVDTHKHEHLARALDGLGQVLGGVEVKASLDGYVELLGWLRSFDDDVVVGIEGTGSYGAGLCEYLLAERIRVVEVERPRREDRRRGKSDEIDALLAAKKVLAAEGLSTPRAGGTRQALQGAARRPALLRQRAHKAAQPAPGIAYHRTHRAARANRSRQRQSARRSPSADARTTRRTRG
ncbi:MAG: IS110 family transposase [Actinomycetota bacterium]|nr:IS110 family transposase [Actinomycetota bacterium]